MDSLVFQSHYMENQYMVRFFHFWISIDSIPTTLHGKSIHSTFFLFLDIYEETTTEVFFNDQTCSTFHIKDEGMQTN